MNLRFVVLAISILLLAGPALAQDRLQVLVMGDSFMTSNAPAKAAVPDWLARGLNARIKSKAVTGASYGYKLPLTGALGLNITKQYRKGNWDWVVMNGGGNDLWLGCGCTRCKKRLDRLISADGRKGLIPATVMRARQGGAQVLYVGYLRSPGRGSPIEHCRKVGDALEARIARFARLVQGVSFLSLADLVPNGDTSFHAVDRIHPSVKGSHAASQRIISFIQRNSQ